MKRRSRLLVGFHRLGVVLATPFIVGALVLVVLQWHSPTGAQQMDLPDGTIGWDLGEGFDDVGMSLLEEQSRMGFQAPSRWIIVGLPLDRVRHENADWTKWQLPDGREIGIASVDPKQVREVAFKFLLSEKGAGHRLADKDVPIDVDGVRVAYLNFFDQFPPAQPPWMHKQREWIWAIGSLLLGLAVYIGARAIGWVFDGFVTKHPTS